MKKTLIEAISNLFRIDTSNILTLGALEAIINRLEVSDYQMFISYLGERNSSFEKPIESITKGVVEFLEIKNRPKVSYAEKMTVEIMEIFINLRVYFADKEKFRGFLHISKDDSFFKTLTSFETKKPVFTHEILDICFAVGLKNIASDLDKDLKDNDYAVYKYLTKDLPICITQQIEKVADTKQFLSLEQIKNKAKLISKGSKND